MFTNHFGIEIEFTGITRCQAAKAATKYLGGTVAPIHDYYDTYQVTARDGRVWKFMYDGSIDCQRKAQGSIIQANRKYSVELVSPVLLYRKDINTLQGLVRRLRKAGGFANPSCGIHIHLDGSTQTVSKDNSLGSPQPLTFMLTQKISGIAGGATPSRAKK